MGLMYNPNRMLATRLKGKSSLKLHRDLNTESGRHARQGGAGPFQGSPRERTDSVKQQADKPGRPVGHALPDPIPDTPEHVMRRLPGAQPKRRDEWDCVQRARRGRERN